MLQPTTTQDLALFTLLSAAIFKMSWTHSSSTKFIPQPANATLLANSNVSLQKANGPNLPRSYLMGSFMTFIITTMVRPAVSRPGDSVQHQRYLQNEQTKMKTRASLVTTIRMIAIRLRMIRSTVTVESSRMHLKRLSITSSRKMESKHVLTS